MVLKNILDIIVAQTTRILFFMGVSNDPMRFRIKNVHSSTIGPDPDISRTIFHQGIYERSGNNALIAGEPVSFPVKLINPATPGTDPKITFFIFDDACYGIITYTIGVLRFFFVYN